MSSQELPWPHAPTHRLDSGGTYFVTASTLHHAQLSESANIFNPIFNSSVSNLNTVGLGDDQAHRLIEQNLAAQAGVLGINDVFFASSLLFLVLIGFIWLSKPMRTTVPVDAGAAH